MLADSVVRRSTAIKALRASGVEVHATGADWYTLAYEGTIVEVEIHSELGSRIVHYFHRVFKVPKHWFYNEYMIPGGPEKLQ